MSALPAEDGAAPSPGAARGRRSLLASIAAGLLGGVAVGCGSSHSSSGASGHRRSSSDRADARTLKALLAVEYYAIAAYTAATPLLDGSGAKLAREFLGQEVLHADRLINLIQRAGGQAQQPQANYDLGHPTQARTLMQLLLQVEEAQLRAYLMAAPALSAGPRKAVAASIMANQAQHAAVWRLQLGEKPAPGAFVTGRE